MPSSSGMPRSSAASWSRVERRGDPDRVLALDAVARMEHPLRPRPVVGKHQQPLGVLVQPPDRVEARALRDERRRDEVDDGRRACRSRVVDVTPAGLCRSR